jgi:hypothetical protein
MTPQLLPIAEEGSVIVRDSWTHEGDGEQKTGCGQCFFHFIAA